MRNGNLIYDGSQITIPRCYLEGIFSQVELYSLHEFCDASQTAYATVVYLVMETPKGQFAKFFFVSKTRVAPLQELTIPQLELLSRLVLAKHMTFVLSALEAEFDLIQSTSCRLHGRALLDCRCQPRVKAFDCWKHSSGRGNPADLPSQALPLIELSINKLWRNGPDW